MSIGDVGARFLAWDAANADLARFLEHTGCHGYLEGAETYPTSQLDDNSTTRKKQQPTAN